MIDCEKYGIMFDPPHVGEIIREEYLKPLKLSVTEAAHNLGISRKAFSELLNGKTGISTRMAIKLSRAFNTSVQFWLNLQQEYELYHTLENYTGDDVKTMRAS
jgi:addiction module HigA family antidote